MKRNLVIGALVVLAMIAFTVIALNPTGQVSLAEQKAVKFGYRQNVAYLPLFVALKNGYFDEEGVKVEPILFESSNTVLDAVVTRGIDVAISNIPLVLSLESKSPGQIKFFTMDEINTQNFYSAIVVRKDSDLKSWEDLKGRKVGTWLGSTAKLLYRKIFKTKSLEGEIEIIQMKPELLIQALESRSVDAIFLLEPDMTIAVDKGIGRVMEEALFTRYVMNPMPAAGAFFSTEFAENNPEQAEKIARAIHKAIDFINDNPEEARKTISDYTPLEENIAVKVHTQKYSKVTPKAKEAVQELADMLYTEKMLDSAVDTGNMFYNGRG